MNVIAYFEGPTGPIAGGLTNDAPRLRRGDKTYDRLADLVRDEPALAEPDRLGLYCRLATFLVAGVGYQPIFDPAAFKEGYQAALDHGPAGGDGRFHTVADFGPFDVSEIGEPRVEGGALTYYVVDQALGVPYRVTAPFPARGEEGELRVEPLPPSGDEAAPEPPRAKARLWLR